MKVLVCCFYAVVALTSIAQAQTAGVLREVWSNLDGYTISSLTSSPAYPGNPVLRVVDASFQSPVNWSDRYGVRMRAFLTSPTTSNYTFWIAGDDSCELWLSTDETPANRVRIATVSGATSPLAWNARAEQRSVSINLVGGKKYYIEALMKEQGGGDSLAVAWAYLPTDTPQVIGSANLTPYEVPAPAPTVMAVEAGKAVTQYAPNRTVNVSAQALDLAHSNQAPTIKWTQVSGTTAIIGTPEAVSSRIDLPAVGTYTFRATATSGSLTGTDDLVVTILPALATDAGTALSEYWFGVSGSTVASLSNS
ncbi:MAG: hypothetical protein JWR15_840, partial [Prosthecobacter sp.]|nr:hypothetical protein [Prosthecobacter sp.]